MRIKRIFSCLMVAVGSFVLGCYATKAHTGYPKHFDLRWYEWVIVGLIVAFHFVVVVTNKEGKE